MSEASFLKQGGRKMASGASPNTPLTVWTTGVLTDTGAKSSAFFFLLVHSLETTACQPLKSDEKTTADRRVEAADRNGCMKGKGRKRHRRARR